MISENFFFISPSINIKQPFKKHITATCCDKKPSYTNLCSLFHNLKIYKDKLKKYVQFVGMLNEHTINKPLIWV
ncbi:hypothetical protein RclHR1_00150065 [Rhizophagus clarus]|uniref:Uncharacterized protein n=1 Tax=Rhizophagus clarus TaxID=94130 RepID=A0A2Z6QRL4_9GLOM|nr:hypothetical protein RclHR1_00150065 [Rhizophagus clarus]GES84766.1 hypothetical protein RCL_e2756_RclHR1_00150065 [Rhizophagus clarus]